MRRRSTKLGLALCAVAVGLLALSSWAATITKTSSPNTAILPDNGCTNDTTGNGAGGITDTIVVTEAGTLTDVNLVVAMTQSWRGDFQVALSYTGGGGTQQLINNHGTSGDNYFATLDSDSANGLCSAAANCGTTTNCVTAPGPTCVPDVALTPFNGLASPGTWTLAVCDRATGDTGTLQSWSLVLTGDPLPVELTTFTVE